MTRKTAHEFMARALQLAAWGRYLTHPNPNVGCVIERAGRIVGEGYHHRAGEPHAEVLALAEAGSAACGATAYVTLEPCCHHGRTPPCAAALVTAGVSRVVVAITDPNPQIAGRGLALLRAAGIDVETGVLADQAAALNSGFLLRMRQGRPWVRVKLAMSLDGRTALTSGESQWITGEAARRDVQFWRARAAAIMTGSGTLLTDDPSLNMRLTAAELGIAGEPRQPLRVLLDPALQTPPSARCLSLPGACLIMTAAPRMDVANSELARVAADIQRVSGDEHALDLEAVLTSLASREINEVQVEAGPTLAGALVQAGLVDELLLYVSGCVLGDTAQGLLRLPALDSMAARPAIRIEEIRAIGEDFRIRARPASTASADYPLPQG